MIFYLHNFRITVRCFALMLSDLPITSFSCPDLNVAQYQIVDGNTDNAFGVDNDTGRIFVMGYLTVEKQAVSRHV